MKFLAGAAIAALVFAAAGFAYSARPTQAHTATAVTPAQFNALKKRVTKLEQVAGALASYDVECLFKYVGVTRRGTLPNSGYVYSTDGNPASGESLSTGLDVTNAGEAAIAYVPATTNTACLTAGSLRRQLARIAK
jgi:hypothetical protein